MSPKRTLARWRWSWVPALGLLFGVTVWWCFRVPSPPEPPADQVGSYLETEDWPGVLASLAADPLTNAVERLALVRALYETGSLPENLFSWIHRPGPDLLSTVPLRKQRGTAYAAATALEIGQVNVAERWAFDSLEMEGENPTALRTLARLHVIKGLPQAAQVFLNRLEAWPAHRTWAAGLQARLAADPAAMGDPEFSRIRSNLVVRDELVMKLSSEIVLGQAFEAHPESSMAFELLMAQLLLTRKISEAVQTLLTLPQEQNDPLPRHHAEVVALLDHLRPGTAPSSLRERVPAAVTERFRSFKDSMDRAGAGLREQVQPEAWREFGDTYWYYHFFGPQHRGQPGLHSHNLEPARPPRQATAAVSSPALGQPVEPGKLPRMTPDYTEVVIPRNLAPLNFTIQEPGTEYRLRLAGPQGAAIEIQQTSPQIRIPLELWKQLLESNQGEALRWEVAIRDVEAGWTACAPFTNQVAVESIDSHLVYRRLQPLYSYYKNLGIYQRDLDSFEERPVLRNSAFNHGCLNCHTFAQGAPDRFVLALRTPSGMPTLLVTSNGVSRLEQKMGYPSWHPNGRIIAFTANTISQFFHVAGPVNRDIYDPRSDLVIYHLDDGTTEKPSVIALPNRSENWPSWSPDGRHLYFCRAPALALDHHEDFRYDLLRVAYDPETNAWGEPETLFSSSEHRLSAHQPRVSPDGRFLLFTVTSSGSFPVFRSDSDLSLMHLDTRELSPLSINSDAADTWHSWSSTGRWLVFGSKRLDGVFTRVFITRVDPDARFSKPLLLPQEDPEFYSTCLDNFNLPELVRGPLQISEADLVQALNIQGLQSATDAKPTPELEDADYHP